MSRFKNRIIGSGEESLDNIIFNPRNWRIHPLYQQDALKGVLDEVGWVQQVIVNQRTGNLIDGHLRCQLAAREGAEKIPVVYVDISEEEEALVLSTLDPISAMAATDKQKLDELLRSFNSDNAQVQALVSEIAEKEKIYEFDPDDLTGSFTEGVGRNTKDVAAITFIFQAEDAELINQFIKENGKETVTEAIAEMFRRENA